MTEQNKLYSINSANILLGCLLNNPSLLLTEKYNLSGEDFSENLFNRIIFWSIRMLLERGCTQIDEIVLDTFLQGHEEYLETCNDNNFLEVIPNLKIISDPTTFEYHYLIVKKFSLLRYYKGNGYDITPFFDLGKDWNKELGRLETFTLEDMIAYYESTNIKAKKMFLVSEDDTTEKKAGENGLETLQKFKEAPMMGLGFESQYLTTLWGGLRKKQLYMRSGDTSSGKSRSCLADLAKVSVSELYNIHTKQWDNNPNGKHKALYIGTEMELDQEVDPILWSYISGVNSDKITKGKLTPEEEERVRKAIKVVNDDCMWISDMPSFTIQKVRDIIKEYKNNYGIEYVGFDYVILNNSLVKEFVDNRGGASGGVREDQILSEFVKNLKDICKEFDIGMLTSSQVNGEITDYRNRDYRVLRGGKSMADKLTAGSISMPITKQELDLIQPYLEKRTFGQGLTPNFVETVYKSRFSAYPKECKIFSYYDLGNMRRHEMFVTDKFFKPINVERTIVNNEENLE